MAHLTGTWPLILLLVGLPMATARAQPALPELPGFQAGPVERFDSKSLFSAINGAAPVFLDHGFVGLQLREYSQPGLVIELGVYDQATPLNAFGVFGRERPSAGEPLELGAQALAAPPRQCLLRKDRYYIKAAAVQGELTGQTCRLLLAALAAALPGSDQPPGELGLLPGRGLLAGTQGYTAKAYLGLGDLERCVHGRYQLGQVQVELFAPVEAELFERLRGRWRPVDDRNPPVLVREIPYRSVAAVVRTGQAVLGVVDGGDAAASAALLRRLLAETAR